MILRLAELLEVPLRERNTLLVAGGFAPMFAERSLQDPALQPAREAIELVLKGHEPYPAIAVDRHWTLLAANNAAMHFMSGVDAALLAPPLNVLRLSLHPDGLAPRIVNLTEWRAHLLSRLRREIEISADTVLENLLEELSGYPAPVGSDARRVESLSSTSPFVVPLRLAAGNAVLSFISTITVFGTPTDVTLSELALESFFPADAATAAVLRQIQLQQQ
jgi:hypothetical protein